MPWLARVTDTARIVSALTLGLVQAGCGGARVVGHTPSGIDIVQMRLSTSSAYLVKSRTPFVVDAGSEGEGPRMDAMIRDSGVEPRSIGAVIATHGHCDHRGAAPYFQARGLPIWLGAGDAGMARAGHNDQLVPTSLTARLVHLTFSDACPPFTPDVNIDERGTSLARFGVDGEVFQLPGHTPGSIVVVLERRVAFVGDVLLGGEMGGAIDAQVPGEHYFQADFARNRRNLHALLDRAIETFYVGHGGPLARADILRALDDNAL